MLTVRAPPPVQYSEFYQIDHVMILGRVSKGAGGDLMMATAKKVLETEFPEIKRANSPTRHPHPLPPQGRCSSCGVRWFLRNPSPRSDPVPHGGRRFQGQGTVHRGRGFADHLTLMSDTGLQLVQEALNSTVFCHQSMRPRLSVLDPCVSFFRKAVSTTHEAQVKAARMPQLIPGL